jgi:uncharacterized Fe-S cluster-containing radical SAM superfamily protein
MYTNRSTYVYIYIHTLTCTHTQWNFTQPQKKNETLSFIGKWMELENIILSEVSPVQKGHMFSLIYGR